MFLSLALIAHTVTMFYIPLFGQSGMRTSLSGVFAVMPALLFGPLYGAITYALLDILGYMLRPDGGGYLPLMTLVVAAGGALRGGLWRLLKKRSPAKMRVCVGLVSVGLLAVGAINTHALRADGLDPHFYDAHIIYTETTRQVDPQAVFDTADMRPVSRMVVHWTQNRTNPQNNLHTLIMSVTVWLMGIGGFGLFLLLADGLTARYFFKNEAKGPMMPLFITMLLGAVFVSTLNTVVLRETLITSWKLLPFGVVWTPRLIQSVLENTLYVYIVAILLGVYEKMYGKWDEKGIGER
jgi:hypothetical protein